MRVQEIDITLVSVDRDTRQRTKIDTGNLLESIRARGVLNPLIVAGAAAADGTFQLIAGERRLECCRQLGLAVVPVRFWEDLDPIEAQIVELEENIKRQDLSWQDIVRSVGKIHRLYKTRDLEWTQEETSQALGITNGTVSAYLKVEARLDDEKISQATTVREAWNILSRRDQRASGEALQEMLDATPAGPGAPSGGFVDLPSSGLPIAGSQGVSGSNSPSAKPLPVVSDPAKSVLQESFLHWAPKYTGRKFNLVHCDFPYGVNLFAGPYAGGDRHFEYDDSKEVFFRLLKTLCENLDRVMSLSGHLMFWYSEKHGREARAMFQDLAPSLVFHPFPMIWHKTDNSGIAQDVRQGPRHVYESCWLATRGHRNIVRVVSDVYGAPTDKRWHPSTKPEPMLRHFMSMLVDEHTSLLDPTCGSASALRAAESLGAQTVLGMDSDEQTVGLARMALRQARTMRGLSVVEG